ncbi:hypothetical protein C8R44DRAFT_863918 [Mycena epipterygia]|nr:hypothetical protein C8R44DRAFT_863918 [Mycena epipterygia]
MTSAGASNIAFGFTIDMQKIDTISLSQNKKTVSIGAGSTWKMVYHALHPHHLTTIGGRTSGVGVAGFLLSADLGRAFFYNISYALPLLDSLVNFTAKLADDPKGMSAFGFLWNSDIQDYIVWAPSHDASLAEITDEVSDLFARGVRTQWFTLTVKANSQILLDIHERGAATFEPDRNRPDFISGLTVQPINVGLAAAVSKNGGKLMGMSTDDGDLIFLLASLFWSEPADDAILIPKFHEFFEWCENEVRQRGLLSRFLYMNYALGNQRVMESVGDENLAKMRKVQAVYDPQSILEGRV